MEMTIYKEAVNISINLVKCDLGVYLAVTDKATGEIVPEGHLIRIKDDGSFKLCRNISNRFGFKLDSAGRLDIES